MTQIEQILSYFEESGEDNNAILYDIQGNHQFKYNCVSASGIGVLKDGSGYEVYDLEYGTRSVTQMQLIQHTSVFRTERVL
jgi:hypothetical protein